MIVCEECAVVGANLYRTPDLRIVCADCLAEYCGATAVEYLRAEMDAPQELSPDVLSISRRAAAQTLRRRADPGRHQPAGGQEGGAPRDR